MKAKELAKLLMDTPDFEIVNEMKVGIYWNWDCDKKTISISPESKKDKSEK